MDIHSICKHILRLTAFFGRPRGMGTVIFAFTVGIFMDAGFVLIKIIKTTLLYKTIVAGQLR